MRALWTACLLTTLAAGAAVAQDAAPPAELPAAAPEAPPVTPPQGGTPIMAPPSQSAPAAAPAADKAGGDGEPKCKPWTAKVPTPDKFPPLGWTLLPPDGPGYYSLRDLLEGNCRQAPPKYPYPRFSLMPWSFFNADFRYLDDPKNTETDFFDPIKRVRLGDDWLFSTGGDYRQRFNNEVNSRLTGRDNYYELYRVRLYGDLWYRDLVRLYAEGIYADTYFQDLAPLGIDRNRGDFLNLFLDVKLWETCKDHPVFFRFGRQELLYGSQRLISPIEWANTRRAFQGAKLFYRGEKWDVDAFVVQPVVPNSNEFDSVDNNQVFSGAWATYRPRKGVWADLYYLNLDNTNPTAVGANGDRGGQNVNTVGGRHYSTEHPYMWDLEGMLQFGGYANQHILAKAFTAGLGYRWKDLPMNPQFWVYYDYASGDPNPGEGGTRRTFNQLFPFGHYYFGYTDVVGRQNINDVNFQVALFPAKWITTLMQYHVYRLDSDKDALYNAAGAPIRRDPTGRAGNEVGEELDFLVNFHLDQHSDILLSYSHLFPGDFLRATGSGRSADYFYAQYTYRW